MKKGRASSSKKEEHDESGEDEDRKSGDPKIQKKPAGSKQLYNIDDSSVDDDVDEEPCIRDKNMVAWFKQYEGTLPKVSLLLIGSLVISAHDMPCHCLETWRHTCCINFV